MDILKKMFGAGSGRAAEKDASNDNNSGKGKVPSFGNEFRKPIWYDEESDDELFDNNKVFGFQVFTNPMEMQKYHEQQLRNMLKAFEQYDETKGLFDDSLREEYMKPGFEEFKNLPKTGSLDVDLDGEIYADQLHTLLQRISPETENMKLKSMFDDKVAEKPIAKRKQSDEEKIMDQIHCIDEGEKGALKGFAKSDMGVLQPRIRIPLGGAFEGFADGPKTHRQTFSYQMIRKPNGSVSTSTVVDPEGNTKTIIKRTMDGETKTQTIINGVDVDTNQAIAAAVTDGIGSAQQQSKRNNFPIDCGRYLFVNKDGYALPKNLW